MTTATAPQLQAASYPELISILIPARNRSDLLKVGLESCFAQAHRPLQILIGDDSDDGRCEDLVQSLTLPNGIGLRYQRHSPRRGQSGNVNWLFDEAAGDRAVLLHDDDWLCLGAIEALKHGWTAEPDTMVVYGKHFVADPAGVILDGQTEMFNVKYRRTPERVGRQRSNLEAALSQQFPHNGYLIDTKLARSVRYRSEDVIGQAVDVDFAIRLAQLAPARAITYIDTFTSVYRLTPNSIMQTRDRNHGQHLLFAFIEQLNVPPDCEPVRKAALRRLGIEAVLDAAKARRRGQALRIMFSEFFDRPLISVWGAYRAVCIVSPAAARVMDHAVRTVRARP